MTTFKALHRFAPALILCALMGAVFAVMAAGASPAMAESHPFLFSFGSFTNPNGIAVEESTGDVYVADIATDTVSRFDADGNPVEFPALHSNTLSGSATPAGSFDFPEDPDTPAAVAVDNSTEPSDPSRGDLYVMDAGHNAIDKFSPDGTYLSQITGPFEEGAIGLALAADGDLRVAVRLPGILGRSMTEGVDLFDNSTANNLLRQQEGGQGGKRDTIKSSRHRPTTASPPVQPATITPSSIAVAWRSSVRS